MAGRADAKKETNVKKTNFDQPSQLLFIWSILMIYQDMAKLFWAEGKVR
ncbi:hypothetical protein MAR_020474 [Mya arenaria]|uniref:TRPM-like domain-containing protein n=1 Tax=Mya arenaria TaxID=6604 RepID=A0ABY7E4Z7_MYAAR|nr:hypothetical protein MAR_020474 [Mya arenaria]